MFEDQDEGGGNKAHPATIRTEVSVESGGAAVEATAPILAVIVACHWLLECVDAVDGLYQG